MKNWFFENINKTIKFSFINQEKENTSINIRNEKERSITTQPTGIKRSTREYFAKHYVNKFDNLIK